MVGNDAAPEFHAKTLPPGTAPKKDTYQPNPIDETPGQANNPDSTNNEDSSGAALAADDFPGATSADVHQGLGHPGSGQTSSEIAHEGKSHRARDRTGLTGLAEGGSGMAGDESQEAKNLQKDHVAGQPTSGKEFNVSLDGAESKENVKAEQVQSMGDGSRKKDYDHSAESAPGSHS